MNEFQPLAEQQILFLFVATGSTAVYALPQYVAELVILAAVYGAARRLGFGVRASACGAALLATFSLVALQATTAQNDLVAASFPIAAASLLLCGGSPEAVLAGVAVGLGLGVELTTALALPVLLWLARTPHRRNLKLGVAGGVLGFLLAGVGGSCLTLSTPATCSARPGSNREHGVTVLRRDDPKNSPPRRSACRSFGGSELGGCSAGRRARSLLPQQRSPQHDTETIGSGGRCDGGRGGAPTAGPGARPGDDAHPRRRPAASSARPTRITAGFVGIGTFALFAAPISTVIAVKRRDSRPLALALALPSYMVLLALYAAYNIWITRFLVVPVVLTAPLFARLFHSRPATAACSWSPGSPSGSTLAHDATKPLGGALGRPWNLTQAQVLAEGPATQEEQSVAGSLVAHQHVVPERVCVGAVLGPDEPALRGAQSSATASCSSSSAPCRRPLRAGSSTS